MVCSPHHLASAAGLEVLKDGGNAVDACVAVNAVLQVVYPPMCHLGGDGFWMVWLAGEKELLGLNGSGPAAGAASRDALLAAGQTTMPQRGPHSVTVPGCVDAWSEVLARCGTMGFERLLAPAARFAGEGFPISSKAALWIGGFPLMTPVDEFWLSAYWPHGRAPEAGEIFQQLDLAATYRRLMKGGRDAFYEGELAERICARVQELGGPLAAVDLRRYRSEWVEPVLSAYRDVALAQMPPNSQGTTLQLILNLLELEGELPPRGAERHDLMLRACAAAYAERDRTVTCPNFMEAPLDGLANGGTAVRVRPRMATARAGAPVDGDTAYFCAVDQAGNCCSAIQSLYFGFGSGIVVPGTGILLQARGACFSLEPGNANRLEGGKRTLHTLMPGMVLDDGAPWLLHGTMGGHPQAQINAQLLTSVVDDGFDVSAAVSAPRWTLGPIAPDDPANTVNLEPGLDDEVGPLTRRGWAARVVEHRDAFGHAHMIEINDGELRGAADPRAESLAAAW
jgi:gamma-glutamyltranspeptidase/glutathione hydrolase